MRVVLDENAILPTRAHDTDAGLDLYSREDKVVPAGGSAVFDTGVHIELPYVRFIMPDEKVKLTRNQMLGLDEPSPLYCHVENIYTVGFLKSKSGLNVKHNITSEGVIDMGYTGSIVVKLYNHGTEDYHVKAGDKISQLVILPIIKPLLERVDKLEDTERGGNGFGSSGR